MLKLWEMYYAFPTVYNSSKITLHFQICFVSRKFLIIFLIFLATGGSFQIPDLGSDSLFKIGSRSLFGGGSGLWPGLDRFVSWCKIIRKVGTEAGKSDQSVIRIWTQIRNSGQIGIPICVVTPYTLKIRSEKLSRTPQHCKRATATGDQNKYNTCCTLHVTFFCGEQPPPPPPKKKKLDLLEK